MFQNVVDAITGDSSTDGNKKMKCVSGDGECKKIKGSVVLMKKNVLDFNDVHASVLDRLHELLGHGVSLQLISSVNCSDEPAAAGEFISSFLFYAFCFQVERKKFRAGIIWIEIKFPQLYSDIHSWIIFFSDDSLVP